MSIGASDRTAGVRFRPARAGDARAIRSLVFHARINPRGLEWQRFLVAEDASGKVAACGQVKPHRDGSRELASIVVRKKLRGHGLGAAMVRRLMAEHGPPLWLMCAARVGGFYERLGFVDVSDGSRMPVYFRRVHRLARVADPLFPEEQRLAIMVWQEPEGEPP